MGCQQCGRDAPKSLCFPCFERAGARAFTRYVAPPVDPGDTAQRCPQCLSWRTERAAWRGYCTECDHEWYDRYQYQQLGRHTWKLDLATGRASQVADFTADPARAAWNLDLRRPDPDVASNWNWAHNLKRPGLVAQLKRADRLLNAVEAFNQVANKPIAVDTIQLEWKGWGAGLKATWVNKPDPEWTWLTSSTKVGSTAITFSTIAAGLAAVKAGL